MIHRILKEDISTAFQESIQNKTFDLKNDTSAVFYDLTFLKERIETIKKCFPKSCLHAVAMKANPLINILKKLNKWDLGAETATLPELHMALKSGFPPNKVVFDSPAKTVQELEYALRHGVQVNADNFSELQRIDTLLKSIDSTSIIGLRINPQVGVGKIESTSVAGEYSKFGISIKQNKEAIIDAYLKYKWLTGIHLHIGSQGCSMSMLIEGIDVVYKLCQEINQNLNKNEDEKKINVFDLGGGLPVLYHDKKLPTNISDYAQQIKLNFPDLFSDNYQLITEFGRYVHVNSGWIASKVEYVKQETDKDTLITHVGADLLLRECYNPQDWSHEIFLVDKDGKIKSTNETKSTTVAGPLCFAGDIIARDVQLPKAEEGDYLIICDTGGYTLSMWSRYNSRQVPKVIAYLNNGGEFYTIKEREKYDEIYKFW